MPFEPYREERVIGGSQEQAGRATVIVRRGIGDE
jgi:hypothetical protein